MRMAVGNRYKFVILDSKRVLA